MLIDRQALLQLFKSATAIASDDYVILDQELKIIYRNKQMQGEEKGLSVSLCALEHVIESQRKAVEAELRKTFDGEARQFLVTTVDANGFETERNVLTTPINLNGQVNAIAALSINLSDKVQIEQAQLKLAHSQRMDMIGQLAGGIAHDLNNKLGSILMAAQSAIALPQTAPSSIGSYQLISDAVDACSKLVKQLMNFGIKTDHKKELVGLNELISASLNSLRYLLPDVCILEFHPSTHELYALVDPIQLDQVLFNLILNARDAIVGAGLIRIQVEPVENPKSPQMRIAARPGKYASIRVSDSGSGIDEKTLAKIFDPFFTTKGQGKGTGLGLAIVFNIVKSSGGSVYVESVPGQGATFTVLLPMAQQPRQEPPLPTPLLNLEKTVIKAKILLIEDDALLRTALTRPLLELTGEVVVAQNAKEGLSLLTSARKPFDLVLSDILMPGMNGIEFVKEALRICPQTQYVLMTGHSAEVLKGLDRTITSRIEILNKPLDRTFLLKTLRRLLENRTPPSQEGQNG